MLHLNSRRTVAATMAAMSVAAIGAPMAANAATSTSSVKTYNYPVTVNKGVLASGTKVSTRTVVTNGQASVSDWYSGKAIASVVHTAINGKYQMPFSSQGYQCTPAVNGATTSFVCKLRGGDVATTVRLTFAAKYAS